MGPDDYSTIDWMAHKNDAWWNKPILTQEQYERIVKVGDPPRPSNFTSGEYCIMCGELLGHDDLLHYHTPHKRGPGVYVDDGWKDPDALYGKDCTPSCMWCAKVFNSKEALEAHEAECQ